MKIAYDPAYNMAYIALREKSAPVETLYLTLSSTVGSEAWNSRDLKSRPH